MKKFNYNLQMTYGENDLSDSKNEVNNGTNNPERFVVGMLLVLQVIGPDAIFSAPQAFELEVTDKLGEKIFCWNSNNPEEFPVDPLKDKGDMFRPFKDKVREILNFKKHFEKEVDKVKARNEDGGDNQ